MNPDILKKVTDDIGVEAGMYECHEFTESYEAGKISLKRKFSSPRAGLAGSVYLRAHNRASFAYNVKLNTTTIKFPVLKKNGVIDFFNTKSVTSYKYSIDDAE